MPKHALSKNVNGRQNGIALINTAQIRPIYDCDCDFDCDFVIDFDIVAYGSPSIFCNAVQFTQKERSIMANKQPKDYLVFPLDVPTEDAAKRAVETLSGHVGMFKIGLELFIRCGPVIVDFVNNSGEAEVFLDLKLHDIPETVRRAMAVVSDMGVRFVTVHCGENPQMLEAAVAGGNGRVGVLGVTVLTSVSADHLKTAGYAEPYCNDVAELVLKRAETAKTAGCAGVVCSGLEAAVIKKRLGPAFFAVTPGIRPAWSVAGKADQQRVTTPAAAVQDGSDYLVIGRPIRDAADPKAAAIRTAEEIAAVL